MASNDRNFLLEEEMHEFQVKQREEVRNVEKWVLEKVKNVVLDLDEINPFLRVLLDSERRQSQEFKRIQYVQKDSVNGNLRE